VILMDCPACRQRLSIPDEFAGQSGRCNFCGSAIVVAPSSTVDPGVADREGRVSPFAAPRRPIRLGAGMVANEVDHAGGAGASLGRIVLLSVLALIITACILPAVVIGFSTETTPPVKPRPTVVPETRGGGPSPATAGPTVYVTSDGGVYHKADCTLAAGRARAISLQEARAAGRVPCGSCGG
jgi:hypothetical protein